MARILIEAIQNGEENLAKEIIMKCASYGGIDSQSSRREGTALFFCCSRGYLELAKLLLEKGASVASTDKNLATPLHGAVDNGHVEVVKLLISHGANINAQNYRGDTPLHLAAYRGFVDITQCLIQAGADFRLVNSNSFTAENEAVGRGHLDLCNYLRTAHNDAAGPLSVDSMIQLDPPLAPQVTCWQVNDMLLKRENYRHQEKQPSEHDEVCLRHLNAQTLKTLRSKSCDYETDMYKNLSVIALDPPSGGSTHAAKVAEEKVSNCRHSTGRLPPMVMFPSVHASLAEQLSPSSLVSPSPQATNVDFLAPFVFPPSTITYQGPTFAVQRSVSSSLQLVTSLAGNYTLDSRRRPSAGSTSSCYSDLGGGSGSDAGSLPSLGSDGSGFFSDSRREDIELQDNHMTNNCVDDPHDNDLVLLSIGVRNPPVQKHKRQLSTKSESTESPDFSDIYDSTLFSLTSTASGPRSFSGPSSAGMDFAVSRVDSKLNRIDANDYRPKIHRTTSATHTFPSPNITMKVRPGYNKSVSAEYAPRFHPNLAGSTMCSGFGNMPSNDLSSSFSIADKPSCSMTCVNIPLN